VRRWTPGSGGGFVAVDAGHSRGPAIRDAVASAVASAADFELRRVVVTIFEVPADSRPARRTGEQTPAMKGILYNTTKHLATSLGAPELSLGLPIRSTRV